MGFGLRSHNVPHRLVKGRNAASRATQWRSNQKTARCGMPSNRRKRTIETVR